MVLQHEDELFRGAALEVVQGSGPLVLVPHRSSARGVEEVRRPEDGSGYPRLTTAGGGSTMERVWRLDPVRLEVPHRRLVAVDRSLGPFLEADAATD